MTLTPKQSKTAPKTGTALVTGASHGIGRALAIFLARRGYRVVCVARTEKDLKETVDRVSAEGNAAVMIPVDLERSTDVSALVSQVKKEFDDLNLLAHLASPRVDPETESTLKGTAVEQIEAYLKVSMGAAMVLTKSLQELLSKNAPSHLFFMSSDWAMRGSHGPAAFGAVKAGIAHFARSIRREMARGGVRTTVLLPGDVASFDVDWAQSVWDIDDRPEDVMCALGDKRILLVDVFAAIGACLDQKAGRIEEIVFAPSNPDYDY